VLNATFRLNLNHSERFQYECDDGLTIIGDSAIQCQHNGSWTNHMFACSGELQAGLKKYLFWEKGGGGAEFKVIFF